MPKRRSDFHKPERPFQTIEQKKRCIEKIKARITELNAFDVLSIQKKHGDPKVKALEVSIDTVLAATFGSGTNEYERYRQAAHLDRAPISLNIQNPWRGSHHGHQQDDLREAIHAIEEAKAEALALLHQAINALDEEIDDMNLPQITPTQISPNEPKPDRSTPHIHISGDNARVNINSHDDQSTNTVSIDSSDFVTLASELSQLKEALANQAKNAQDHTTVETIANAELAANEKNSSKIALALSGLGTASHWVLKIARDLGIALAAKAIESQIQ